MLPCLKGEKTPSNGVCGRPLVGKSVCGRPLVGKSGFRTESVARPLVGKVLSYVRPLDAALRWPWASPYVDAPWFVSKSVCGRPLVGKSVCGRPLVGKSGFRTESVAAWSGTVVCPAS